MKKVLFIFIISSLISIVIFTGCNKRSDTANSNNEPSIPEPRNSRDLKIARMFDSFINNGKSQIKDEEEMCPDSAIWYIEGTANYNYGSASAGVSYTIIDSTFITLPVENELISSTEVWNAYTVMIDTIRTRFLELNGAESQLLSVEVKRQLLSSTELECKVTFIFGAGALPPDFCSFNQVDSWMWWDGGVGAGGTCNTNPPQNPDLDAAMLITQKIMNCKGVPAGNYYWEPIADVELFPLNYPYNEAPGPFNFYHFLMFWNDSDSVEFHGCLSPEECEFYRIGTKWVVNTSVSYGGARPEGLSLISTKIWGSAIFAQSTIYLHRGIAYYGILHWNINPPIPL